MDKIPLTKAQIRLFLYRLAGNEGCRYDGIEWRCGGPQFTYAKNILTLMKIPEAEQEKLLEICRKYGGYCDCEILMNAASKLLGKETPW